MINKIDKRLRKVCATYEQVENYDKAIADKENKWHLHHRRETDEMKSKQQLIDEGRYYDLEPEELIFLIESEHNSLHHKDKIVSEETRKKMSESHIGIQSGENHPFFGKHHTEEIRNKLSKCNKGENSPLYGKRGEMNHNFGRTWWNNGKVAKLSKECPGEGFMRGRLKRNK